MFQRALTRSALNNLKRNQSLVTLPVRTVIHNSASPYIIADGAQDMVDYLE